MKKYNIITAFFKKPLTAILFFAGYFIVIFGLMNWLKLGTRDSLTVIVVLSAIFALISNKSSLNDKLKKQHPEMFKEETARKNQKSANRLMLLSALFGGRSSSYSGGGGYSYKSNYAEKNRQYQDERRRREAEADRRARERWHAQDQARKAEWRARDAALRGKDKGARVHQNDADYWNKQARR